MGTELNLIVRRKIHLTAITEMKFKSFVLCDIAQHFASHPIHFHVHTHELLS